MDTTYELRQDAWWQNHLEMCGTCGHREKGVCECEKSPLYCNMTDANNGCDEYFESVSRRIGGKKNV